MDSPKKYLGAIPLWITGIAPFILPALLILSVFFAFIAPLPLFLLSFKDKFRTSFLALLANSILVFYYFGFSLGLFITLYLFSVGLFFPFLIRRSGKIELSFLVTFLYLITLIFVGYFFYAHQAKMGLVEFTHFQLSQGLDFFSNPPKDPSNTELFRQMSTSIANATKEIGSKELLLKEAMTILPSRIMITLFLNIWINLVFASRLVKGVIPDAFWSSVRLPELLVWPTLICGALSIWSDHALYYIALNGLTLLLVIYAFQGMSILSFFMNHYKIFGFGRGLLFFFVIFIATPFVLSLGFFDLWFDFRKKFGQS